jgi:hypothetical protein
MTCFATAWCCTERWQLYLRSDFAYSSSLPGNSSSCIRAWHNIKDRPECASWCFHTGRMRCDGVRALRWVQYGSAEDIVQVSSNEITDS